MMALVDVEYYEYDCPHCKGKIVVRKQTYYDGGGSTHSVHHKDLMGEETELKETDFKEKQK